MVDDEDYEWLSRYKWRVRKCKNTNYAVRNTKRPNQTTIQMHREIMNTPKGFHTDHIDGNGLNNRKSNLRIVTTRQNLQNRHVQTSSKYIGVDFHKATQKWRSRIMVDRKEKTLGFFKNEIDAHEAYLNALLNMNETFVDDIGKRGIKHGLL